MHLSYILSLGLLAQITHASISIDEICSYTLATKMESIICLRDDQPLDEFPKEVSATASLGATGVKLCCPKGDTCLLSNETQPEVLCYNSTDKIANSHSNTRKCDLQDGKCAEGSFAMSTEGVLTITSVVDGEGRTGDSESSSSSSTNGSAALAVFGDTGGLLMAAFMAVVGGSLAL